MNMLPVLNPCWRRRVVSTRIGLGLHGSSPAPQACSAWSILLEVCLSDVPFEVRCVCYACPGGFPGVVAEVDPLMFVAYPSPLSGCLLLSWQR